MTVSTVVPDLQPPLRWLAAQQRRIIGIVDGLGDDAMRKPVLPSGWSCAGMLQHLTASTTFWLDEVVAGQPIDSTNGSERDVAERDEPALSSSATDDFGEADFRVDPALPTSEIVAAYAATARDAAELVRGISLDAAPGWWPDGKWGGWRLDSCHDVLLHLLVETACHAGHLDAARELIDGRTWDYSQGRLTAPVAR